jgi:hypothetical protein
MVKRKRGGQPGNVNTLKHGFYSHTFRSEEREDLEAMLAAASTSVCITTRLSRPLKVCTLLTWT